MAVVCLGYQPAPPLEGGSFLAPALAVLQRFLTLQQMAQRIIALEEEAG